MLAPNLTVCALIVFRDSLNFVATAVSILDFYRFGLTD